MLRRKLFRTMLRYKAQFISMILMITLGVGVFIGFNMEWYSLEIDTKSVYDETGFADYRIFSEGGFSRQDLEAVLSISGVEDAARYLSVNTSVKGDTDIIALTVNENMNVSGLLLMSGEPYDALSPDGIWLSDQYAEKNNLAPGDSLTLTYKIFTLSGTIRGLVKSSEYMICLPDSSQMMPDYSSYGFAFISPVMLKKNIFTEFYPQINVKSGLEKSAFTEGCDRVLGKTTLVTGRDETVSWAEVQGEITEGKTMGSILPVIFLAIAVLTMVTTMHRITASEKTQIGTLKALGFHNARIMRHYTLYAVMIGLIGSLLGIGAGCLLGWYILSPGGAMSTYIDIPSWALHMPGFCWGILAGILFFLTLIGFLSVRKMLEGTAADALRPYTPKKMKHLKLEETKAFKRLNFGTKWNLRDTLRHKTRTVTTLFGVLGCTILLTGGLGMSDTMNAFIESFYNQAIRYDSRINLDIAATTNGEASELAESLEGDLSAITSVELNGNPVSLEVYHITHDLVRFPGLGSDFITLGEEGVWICSRIAREQHLNPGDTLTFSPYGSDQTYTARVAGITRSMSKSILMSEKAAASIGYEGRINTIYTVGKEIPFDGRILNVQSKQAILDSFDTFMKLMNVMVFLLAGAAVALGIVVLYNLGVMSYTERYREMATLKVVGFKDRKIGRLLIGQNLWLTVIGILLGLPAGWGVLRYLLDELAGEYELQLVIGPVTILITTLLTLGVSLAVGLMVARKNRSIDMVSALKSGE